jgi:hypothetical protein
MSSAQSSQSAPAANLFCISCGYNQHGITSGRCPECGQDFSTLAPSPSRLPWLQRRHLGGLRAYWRTALMVIFRTKIFCEEIENPITLKDARRFWLLTIALAYLPLVGAAVQIYHTPSRPDTLLRHIQTLFVPGELPLPIGVFAMLGLLLFIISATGMPSYFCHPQSLSIERQNRAIALSYFACAPLALMPFVVALLLCAQLLARLTAISLTLQIVAVLIGVFMLVAWYGRTTSVVLTLSQRRRKVLTVLLLPLSWGFLLVLLVFVIPISLWYASLTSRILF